MIVSSKATPPGPLAEDLSGVGSAVLSSRSSTPLRVFNAQPLSKLVRYALCLFAFSICFEYYDPWGMSGWFTLSKMAGILLGVACVWDSRRVLLRVHWSVLALGWTWFVLAFSTLLVARFELGPLVSLAQCFVLYWLCTSIFRDRNTAVNALLAFACGAFLVSILMILGIGIEAQSEGAFERITFLGTNANMIGIWETVGIVIVIGVVVQNPLNWGRFRFALLLLLPLLLHTLVNTGSRGAAVSLGMGLLCFLLTKGNLWKRIAGVLLAFTLIAAAFWWAQDSILSARMTKTLDAGSLAGREELWPAAISMIQQKPILGWGMWGDGTIAADLGELNGKDPHNVFLAFFVFGGVFAGVPLLLLALWWVQSSYRARKSPWGVLPLALGVVILSSMFKGGGFYLAKVAWFILALMTASAPPRLSRKASPFAKARVTRSYLPSPVDEYQKSA